MTYHRLLNRQLKDCGLPDATLPTAWRKLLDTVSRAYQDADSDRTLLERSLEISSHELSQANAEMRAIVQAFPDIFFLLQSDGTILDYKGHSLSDFYLPPEQLVGKRIQDIPLGGVGEQFSTAIADVQQCRSMVSLEYAFTAQGREEWYEARVVPIKDNQILVVIRNITGSKRNEKQIEEQLGLKAFAAEVGFALTQAPTIQNGLCVVTEAMMRHLRGAFARIWTLDETRSELILQASAGLYTNIEGAHFRVPVGQYKIGLIAQSRQPTLTNQVVGDPRIHDQEWATREGMVAFAGYPLLVGERVLGVMAMFAREALSEDVLQAMQTVASTVAQFIDRKRIEEALRDSEARFRAFMDNSPAIVFIKDEGGRYLYVNERFEHSFRVPSGQWLGKSVFDLWDAQTARRLFEHDALVLNGNKTVEEIESLPQHDGEHAWLVSKFPMKDRSGRRMLAGVGIDITERQRAQSHLARLAAIVESSEDAIIGKTLDGIVTSWNHGAERLYGYSAEEMIGQSISILMPPEIQIFLQAMLDQVRTGESVARHDTRRVRKDGSQIEISLTVTPIKNPEGQVIGVSSIAYDISDRKQAEKKRAELEAQLRHSQKMEMAGQLAGGVAHDFNNLLTVINGYADLALHKLPSQHPIRTDIGRVKEAGRRAVTLTQQILAFSRKQAVNPVMLTLNEVVIQMEPLLRRLIGEQITVVMTTDPLLGNAKADRGQIEQVLMNLVVNARDAMPAGGTVTIETHSVNLAEHAVIAVNPSAKAGPYVQLTVRDTGCGMDEDTQKRIFEPFFTTKEEGKGTGLGLAIVYGIVLQSGGLVWVESQIGTGTTFHVCLPQMLEEIDSAPGSASDLDVPKGTETILLVEDEDIVRSFTRQVLRGLGYTVLDARHGPKAIEICDKFTRPIALLLTDLVMPEISGLELSKRLGSARPDMKVMYMSAYDANFLAGLPPEAIVLHKPFPPDLLARKIREVLDEERLHQMQ